MDVIIWDLDWFWGMSKVPNVDCMKLSSYHKQRGDSVSFVTDVLQTKIQFDRMYIARVSEETEVPESKLLRDKRVMLIGSGFKYYGAKNINTVVASCRPDYLLYPLPERSPYANANFVQFYCGKTLLKQRQDFHNTLKHHKKTAVVDSYFWKATEEEIIYCLEELKGEKNIAFLKPIWLSKIIYNKNIRQKFLALHFSTGTDFIWKNDLEFNSTNVAAIIDFMEDMRQKTKSNLGCVPFKVNVGGENDESTLANAFLTIDKFKQHKLACSFEFIGLSSFTKPFNMIEKWTKYNMKLSFVEHVTHTQSMIEGLPWEDIVNYSYKWRSPEIDWMLYFLTSPVWENIRPCLYRQWGEDYIIEQYIDFDFIKEHINILFAGEE